MMTDRMLKDLNKVANAIDDEKPGLVLFAALLRTGAFGNWDIVVVAPWVEAEKYRGYHYVADLFKKYLTMAERGSISRIVILHPDEEAVRRIAMRAVPWKDGIRTLDRDFLINDMEITEGYIFINKIASEAY